MSSRSILDNVNAVIDATRKQVDDKCSEMLCGPGLRWLKGEDGIIVDVS